MWRNIFRKLKIVFVFDNYFMLETYADLKDLQEHKYWTSKSVSYAKLIKFWRFAMQHCACSSQYCIEQLKVC